MKKFLKGLIAGLGLLALTAVPASAQSFLYYDRIFSSATASAYVSADDLDVVILFKYVGPLQSGLFTATNGTTLTLTSGVAAAEAADTSIECPLSAPYGGVLDISNAACDTAGELVDIVNGTAGSNWRAVILDGQRSDVLNARIKTNAARQAKSPDGVALNWATATAFMSERALVPPGFRSIRPYLDARNLLIDKPFLGTRTVFLNADVVSTYASGTSFFDLLQVFVDNNPGRGLGAETVSLLRHRVQGATTVWTSHDYVLNGLPADKDCKLILKINNSAAASVVGLASAGLFFRYPKL